MKKLLVTWVLGALILPVHASIVLSTTGTETLDGLRFRNGDLAEYFPAINFASLFFSEGFFAHKEDIDAVALLANGNIVLSTRGKATLGGLNFRDGDLVEYDPVANTAILFFSEDLFSKNEDIDAVSVLANGNIVLSTRGKATLGGLNFRDGDLVEFDPVAKTASLFFSEDLFSKNEGIDAVSVLENGDILFSTNTAAKLGGLRFRKNDLIQYNILTDRATLYLSGGYFRSGNSNIDAVHDTSYIIPEPATLLLLGFGGILFRGKGKG